MAQYRSFSGKFSDIFAQQKMLITKAFAKTPKEEGRPLFKV